jgi:hypothetical protein
MFYEVFTAVLLANLSSTRRQTMLELIGFIAVLYLAWHYLRTTFPQGDDE